MPVFWEATAARTEEFVAKGHRRREVFAHRVHHLPKCGPDGLRLASAMCGIEEPWALFELVLYAAPERLDGLPRELFFDDDVVWHQQQFGMPGQIASANVVLEGDTVSSMAHVSDLVQRIGRRREHKTQIEKRFAGWAGMLLNAALDFAAQRGARTVRTPTAAFALRHTDPSRAVDPELFERAYDRTVTRLAPARPAGDWWAIDVREARDRIVRLERREEQRELPRKVICLHHDIERGRGHTDIDPALARRAEHDAPAALEAMLGIEARAGVRATYGVVGELLDDVRAPIEEGGHALAFHSFDHGEDGDQLYRCREVDYRLKGYRPAQSTFTAELRTRNLLHHNFEWVAASRRRIAVAAPSLRAGIVWLPIAWDDHPLHVGAVDYDAWLARVLELAGRGWCTAISLHDCYAPSWMERYPALLEQLGGLGELWTLDQVAAEVTLAAAT